MLCIGGDRVTSGFGRFLSFLAAAGLILIFSGAGFAQTPARTALGESVYKQRCAGCHDQVNPRIPPRSALSQMPATRILRTLDFGAMMTIAYPMSRNEREAVAAYLRWAADENITCSVPENRLEAVVDKLLALGVKRGGENAA